MIRILYAMLPSLFVCLSLGSCLKKEFDSPPDKSFYDPGLEVTHSIADVLAMAGPYQPGSGGPSVLVEEPVVLSGVVSADDRSGNFFKRIVIQDHSAAVTVLIDAYSLYNDYPVGRKIYIQCNGLYVGYDGGLPVLGGAPDEQMAMTGIKGAQITAHIIKANIGNAVHSDTVNLLTALDDRPTLYNRLITIPDVEFTGPHQNYTQPNATTNRYVTDCRGEDSLTIRSSNYAGFAFARVAQGRGYITGIYTVYVSGSGRSTPQLVIRDTTDVVFDQPRCSSPGDGEPVALNLISVSGLRGRFTQGKIPVDSGTGIRGVVISDRSRQNTPASNLILQDETGGILIRFSENHNFVPGDEVEVNLTGGYLNEFNGLLQAGSVDNTDRFPVRQVRKTGAGKQVSPAVVTVSDLTGAGFKRYESMLVTINGATVEGGTFTEDGKNTNRSVTDDTDQSGRLKLYTRGNATFGTRAIPSGRITVTGIVGVFGNTRQISVRSEADIRQ